MIYLIHAVLEIFLIIDVVLWAILSIIKHKELIFSMNFEFSTKYDYLYFIVNVISVLPISLVVIIFKHKNLDIHYNYFLILTCVKFMRIFNVSKFIEKT